MQVTIEQLLAALLACLEGAKLQAYQDPGGIWTIGIGHTKGVAAGMVITPAEMAALFAADQAPMLRDLVGRPVLEATALGSFGFNCGHGALLKILAGADTLENPVHTTDRTGAVRPGLVNRRHLEALLFALAGQLVPGSPSTT